jgi:hypothetical protein
MVVCAIKALGNELIVLIVGLRKHFCRCRSECNGDVLPAAGAFYPLPELCAA